MELPVDIFANTRAGHALDLAGARPEAEAIENMHDFRAIRSRIGGEGGRRDREQNERTEWTHTRHRREGTRVRYEKRRAGDWGWDAMADCFR